MSADPEYRAEIEAWRRQREAALRADDGWLSLAGLLWLDEGTSTVGSDPECDLVLPEGSAPARVGTFERRGGQISIHVEPGADVRHDGEAFSSKELAADRPGPPDILKVGRLTLFLLERAGRYGIRLKDPESPARRGFKGLRWYPIRESHRITARFIPHDPPQPVRLLDPTGHPEDRVCPGTVQGELNGQTIRLDPVTSLRGDRLFLAFRDETSGRETYEAGRFLYTAAPRPGGEVILDFNRAYSPPCAFTDFAPCPLPPPQNRLAVAVEAGEKAPPGL
jgi:uncharacterized protein (DUF1684 family)